MVLHTTPCEVWSVGCGRVSSAGSGSSGPGKEQSCEGCWPQPHLMGRTGTQSLLITASSFSVS